MNNTTAHLPPVEHDGVDTEITDSTLHPIANGVTPDGGVNVCHFISVGTKILKNMKNTEIFTISFKNGIVKTLGYSAHIKTLEDECIAPALLFQRLKLVAKTSDLDLDNKLEYEMCV